MEEWQQLCQEDGTHVVLRLVEGVHTLCLESANDVAAVGEHPVCLGASAVCYEFHGGKSTQIKLKKGILLCYFCNFPYLCGSKPQYKAS
jgi:hypothetical protein